MKFTELQKHVRDSYANQTPLDCYEILMFLYRVEHIIYALEEDAKKHDGKIRGALAKLYADHLIGNDHVEAPVQNLDT